MSFNFQAGHRLPARWTATGQNAVTMRITGWSGDDAHMLHVVTNTGTEGLSARIAGVQDIDATITYDIDIDQANFDGTTYLRNPYSGLLVLYVTPSKGHVFPMIVEKCHYESAVGSQLKGSATLKMNCIINGAVVTPQYGVDIS